MSDDYLQPEFYRFNEDSIRLVKWIQATEFRPYRILDLGAGCGVIGIELALVLSPNELTLLEVQPEFLPYLEENCKKILPKTISHSIIVNSFHELSTTKKFDLIVCNPPYYLPGKGELAKNKNRAIARSFLIDSWPLLLNKMSELLDTNGKIFLILKLDENLLQMISKGVLLLDLNLKKYDVGSNMILELFRLNEN